MCLQSCLCLQYLGVTCFHLFRGFAVFQSQIARSAFRWSTSVGIISVSLSLVGCGGDTQQEAKPAAVGSNVNAAPAEIEAKPASIEPEVSAVPVEVDAKPTTVEPEAEPTIDAAAANDDPSYKRVGQQIQELIKSRGTVLRIDAPQLTKLPPEIWMLSNLKVLILRTPQFTTLPPDIGKLTQLKNLAVDAPQLTKLPPEIWMLTNLESLGCTSQLTTLPPDIGKLSELKRLGVNSPQLTSLPAEIGNLANLKSLTLGTPGLTDADLKHLSTLKNLNQLILDETFTDEGIAALQQTLPDCGIFSMPSPPDGRD
jgi:Leucine-rich repeat (LRR) protein